MIQFAIHYYWHWVMGQSGVDVWEDLREWYYPGEGWDRVVGWEGFVVVCE